MLYIWNWRYELFNLSQHNFRQSTHCCINLIFEHTTPGPLYNTLHYNTVLDITLITVGPQLDILDYFYSHYNMD